jgi:hypothetical protein
MALAPSFARNQEKAAQPLMQDEACLACHRQAGMKSEKGVDISHSSAETRR